jgi:hypothetical protein
MGVKNRNYLVALLLLLVFTGYFREYIFFGQDASVRVHDNLDSDVVYRHHLVKENLIFAGPLEEVRPIMNGLPRVCLPSGLNFMLGLYWLFGTFGGFVASEFLVHILAYFGIYVLLKNHFLKEDKHFWMRHLAALFFATMPFFPVTGGAVALQPLLLNAFLNIRNTGRFTFKDLLPIVAYPFYSSFVWVGLFILLFLGGFSLYNFYSLGIRKSMPFVGAVALLTGLMVVADYQLFMVFLQPASFFVSHRTNFEVELNYNFKGVLVMGFQNAATGIYHSAVYAGPVLLFIPVIALIGRRFEKASIRDEKFIFVLGAIFLFFGLMTTFWFWEKMEFLYAPGSTLTQINFSRFHYLLPLSGFAMAFYAYRFIEKDLSRYLVAGLLVLGTGWHCFQFYEMHHFGPIRTVTTKDDHVSFREYFSEDIFKGIKQASDRLAGTQDYNVLAVGLQPAVLQYNGFNTLDSYQNFYPLAYEQQFSNILAKELVKCPALTDSPRYRIHNNCYVLSCEMFLQEDPQSLESFPLIHELLLDPDAIRALNGRFIVSSKKIEDFGTERIKEVGKFEHPQSRQYQRMYLYEVI